jgi:hypothetical protein
LSSGGFHPGLNVKAKNLLAQHGSPER